MKYLFIFSLYSVLAAAQNPSPEIFFQKAENFKSALKPDSAMYYFEMAAPLFKNAKNYEKYVDCYNQIGVILTRQDNYEKAKTYLNEALTFGTLMLGEDHLSVATTYISLGVIYNAEEYYDASLKLHHKALDIRLKKVGRLTADVATSYGNIGNVELNNKNFDNAIKAHQEALDIRKVVFGDKGNELIQSYNNLGKSYKEKGDFKPALENFESALELRISQRGPDHKDVATIYKYISDVYFLMKNEEKGNLFKNKAGAIN